MIGQINDVIALVGAFIFFVAWFIRLESKVNYLDKDYLRHLESQKQKDAVIWTKMDDMQKSINSLLQIVGRIEGKLESHKD